MHAEQTDREALQDLAQLCDPFSPLVGVEETAAPECLLLDVTGLGSLFHGEENLLAQATRAFERRGWRVRSALADTVGAAWALAHYGAGAPEAVAPPEPFFLPPGHGLHALAGLPVEGLRLSDGLLLALGELGLRQIGQLALLDRASLAARLGPELLLRLDQAAGQVAEVIVARQSSPEIEARWNFEQPTERPEMLAWAISQQLQQALRPLADRRYGVRQVELRLRGQTGVCWETQVGLFRATAEPRHLEELLQMRWEGLPLSEPIEALELRITATGPIECRQQELFAGVGRQPDPQALAMLVDRLSSRLGRQSVVRARVLPEAQPEYAWHGVPLIQERLVPERPIQKGRGRVGKGALFGTLTGAARPRPRRKAAAPIEPQSAPLRPLQRPLRLLPQPAALDVISLAPHGPPATFWWSRSEHRLERSWGPERIETGWWRGRPICRDYYRVQTTAGQWFWVYRRLTDGRWFLQGAFD